jgi:hypothetical protein
MPYWAPIVLMLAALPATPKLQQLDAFVCIYTPSVRASRGHDADALDYSQQSYVGPAILYRGGRKVVVECTTNEAGPLVFSGRTVFGLAFGKLGLLENMHDPSVSARGRFSLSPRRAPCAPVLSVSGQHQRLVVKRAECGP